MRKRTDPTLDHLRAVRGLGALPEHELERLAGLVEECDVPAGTVLVREGTAGRSTYVVLDGWAAVSIGGTVVAALGPGDHIGETAALGDQPRSATITAKTAMRLLVIGEAVIAAHQSAPAEAVQQ